MEPIGALKPYKYKTEVGDSPTGGMLDCGQLLGGIFEYKSDTWEICTNLLFGGQFKNNKKDEG